MAASNEQSKEAAHEVGQTVRNLLANREARLAGRDSTGKAPASQADLERLAPWNEARFGMFIHWGISE